MGLQKVVDDPELEAAAVAVCTRAWASQGFDELERRCFVVLSRYYLDHQISGGCSDFDAHKEVGLTDAECDELHRRVAEWNEPGSEPLKGRMFSDCIVFAYLRSKFRKPGEK